MQFEVHGPIVIPRKKNGHVDMESISSVWREAENVAVGISDAMGCYVFAISAGRGELPWYVGQTKGSFKQECFTPHKLNHYNDVLADRDRGTPHIYLMPRVTPHGKFSSVETAKDVDFLEHYLIGLSLRRNPDLRNTKDTSIYREIHVPGVLNAKRGRQGAAAQRVRALLGIDSD